MANRDELNNKRAKARKLHQRATAKVSRLKAKGVDVTASGIDPRRDLSNLKRLNSKQLDAHIKRLETFTSRRTRYAPGKGGEALPGDKWSQIEHKVRVYNKGTASEFERIKDIRLKSLGNITIGEYQALKTPDHPTAGNPASRAPHWPIQKQSEGIAKRQLDKNIAELDAKLSPDYQRRVLSGQRWAAYRMLSDIGETKLIQDLVGLSDRSFNVLWNYTTFAEAEATYYQRMLKHMHDDKRIADQDSVIDTQIRRMHQMLREVKKLNL